MKTEDLKSQGLTDYLRGDFLQNINFKTNFKTFCLNDDKNCIIRIKTADFERIWRDKNLWIQKRSSSNTF